jgi:tryptophan-rich sensory protein
MKSKFKKRLAIFLSIALCLCVGGIAGSVTQAAIPVWYAGLNKPFFTPPNWLFGPVWTLLYILMGWSAGWIWSYGSHHKWVKTALYHFAAQLILNGLWSLVFFGYKNILGGILIILTLIILVILTIKWFKIINKKASYLLYPYVGWLLYATALNIGVYLLN